MANDDLLPAAWERPVCIITTGRSGSTLLLRYLNCARDLVVWGEHAGILSNLVRAHAKLTCTATREFVAAARSWLPNILEKRAVTCPSEGMTVEWVNSFDADTVRRSLRRLIIDLFTQGLAPSVRWGFKEIHYGRPEVDLLRHLFDGPRFLVLLRDPVAVIRSKFKWFALEQPAAMTEHWQETLSFFRFARAEVIGRRAPDICLVHYERLVAHPAEEMARIAAFIDGDFLDAQVAAIAGERTSRAPLVGDIETSLRAMLDDIAFAPPSGQIEEMAGLYAELVAAADRPSAASTADACPASETIAAAA